jgi:Mrp family chromosome partitioning ATPase
MSIVERALKKSQELGRRVRAEPPKAREEDVVVTAGRDAPPPMPRDDEDEFNLTSRDLKQIVDIDEAALREAGRLPPAELARRTDDEMRRIKWPLLNGIAGREGLDAVRNNVVLITSAVPGEGKTYTALNLALSIVRDRAIRVVLVDADVARPGLTPSLRMDGKRGLNDVLDDPNLGIESATYRTSVEGLFFVPAGKWHEHAPEFFAGERMEKVMADLVQRARSGVIIFDSPPLLATNEAQAVTRLVGQVLLVVRAESTEQRAVKEALALVHPSTPVSAVLNCVEPSFVGRYYGNYYYGGYERQPASGKGGA